MNATDPNNDFHRPLVAANVAELSHSIDEFGHNLRLAT